MGKGNEVTTKLKVDVTNFKKNIQEATRNMKLAEAEFKAASASMDNWSESTDGISLKLNALNATLVRDKAKLADLENQYKEVAESQGLTSAAAQNLLIKVNNQRAAIGKTEKQIKSYSNKLQELEEKSNKSASASEKLRAEIDRQEKELSDLKNKYQDVILVQGKNSKEAKELKSKINSLSGELKQNKDKLGDAQEAADSLTDAFGETKESAEDLGDGFTVLKGAIASLVADAIRKGIEALKDLAIEGEKSLNTLQTKTGLGTKELEKFQDVLYDLYKNNYGESLEDVADAMSRVIQTNGNLDSKSIENITKKAIILRDTFDFDVNESMRAVDMLMQQFGITADQAFDLVARGAQAGLDKNGDLLDSINEYSVHYSQMGVDAEGFFNSLLNGTEAGTFSVDKLGDAYKEFGIRVKDTNTTTEEAYKLLGLNADEMRAKFAEGGESATQATAQVLEALFNMGDKVEQNQAGVGLFGTMWEDLGITGVQALTNISNKNDALKDVYGTLEEIDKVKYDDLQNVFSQVGRTIKTEMLQPLAEEITPKLKDLGNWIIGNIPKWTEKIKEVADKLKEWTPFIAGIGAAIATHFVVSKITGFVTAIKNGTAAFKLLNFVMGLNPIALLVAAIAGLVVGFVVLWNKSEAFRNFWLSLWEAIKGATAVVVSGIVNFFTVTIPEAWAKLKGKLEEFKTFWLNKWEELKTATSNVIDNIIKFFTQTIPEAWNNFLNTCADFILNVITFFEELPYKIGYVLGLALGKVIKLGIDLHKFATTEIPKFVTNIINFIKELPSKIWQWLEEAFTKVTLWGIKMLQKAIEVGQKFVTNAINFIKQLPSKIWQWLTDAFAKVTQWGVKMLQKATEVGSRFITNTINFIKQLPSKIAQFLQEAISKVISWATQMAEKAKEAGTKFINNTITAIKELPSKIQEKLKAALDRVIKWATDLLNKGKEAGNSLKDGVVEIASQIPDKMLEIGGHIVSGVWNGIVNAKDKFFSDVKNFFKGMVDGVCKELGIESPSKVMKKRVGKHIVTGVASGIKSQTDYLMQTVKKLLGSMTKTLEKGAKNGTFEEAGTNVIDQFKNGIENNLSKVTNSVGKIVDKAVKKLKEKDKEFADQYEAMGNGLIEEFTKSYTAGAEVAIEKVTGAIQKITQAAQAEYNAALAKQDAFKSTLENYGDLFDKDAETGEITLTDISKDTNYINEYSNNLAKLKGKISDELLNEIVSMSVEDGAEFTKKLLSISDADLRNYNNAYLEKLRANENIAKNYYKDEIAAIKKNFTNKVEEQIKTLTADLEKVGKDAAQGFVNGFNKLSPSKEMKKFTDNLVKTIKKELKIKSPSRVFGELGMYSSKGYINNFIKTMKEASKTMVSSIPIEDIRKTATGAYSNMQGAGQSTGNTINNFYQTINSPKALSRLEIYRQTKNQLNFAKGV